jgi:hypothetical protein
VLEHGLNGTADCPDVLTRDRRDAAQHRAASGDSIARLPEEHAARIQIAITVERLNVPSITRLSPQAIGD